MSKLLSALQHLEAIRPAALSATEMPQLETAGPAEIETATSTPDPIPPEPDLVIGSVAPAAEKVEQAPVTETVACEYAEPAEQYIASAAEIDLDALHSLVSEALSDSPPAVPPRQEAALEVRRPAPRVVPAPDSSQPLSVVETAIRKLRDHLLSMPPAVGAVRIFASAAASNTTGECVLDLCMALAESMDDEILVVDADLDRASLAARFGLKKQPGLTDVVAARTPWKQAIQRTSLAKIDFLSTGHVALAEILADSSRVEVLLRDLRRSYRLVLIEAGAVWQPHVPQLARHCEGAYLMLPVGATRQRDAARAERLLTSSGVNVLGCVLTGMPQ